MVIKLDFYFLKYYKDKDGFGFWKRIGMNVLEIQEPEKIDDVGSYKTARDIKDRIEKEMQYPGTVKVTVIRETRAIEEAK